MIPPTPPYWRAWQRRLSAALFPYRPTEPPASGDGVASLVAVVPVLCNVSLWDCLRLFLTGRCEVLVKSVVENGVPGKTSTSFSVLPPRDWACDPPPPEFPAVIVLPSNMPEPVQVVCPAPLMEYWLQGRAATPARRQWYIGGIYDSEARAVSACSTDDDFVVPFRINTTLNHPEGVEPFPHNVTTLYHPMRNPTPGTDTETTSA